MTNIKLDGQDNLETRAISFARKLSSNNSDIIRDAVQNLSEMGEIAATPTVIKILTEYVENVNNKNNNYNLDVAHGAAQALSKIGRNGLDVLGKMLKQDKTCAIVMRVLAICPFCAQGSLFLYKLLNKHMVAICDECESIWYEPSDIKSNGAITNNELAQKFGVTLAELFKNSDWATRDEAESSSWKELVKNNFVRIK